MSQCQYIFKNGTRCTKNSGKFLFCKAHIPGLYNNTPYNIISSQIKIDLSNNNLKTDPVNFIKVIENMPKLTDLDLSQNNFI